MAVNFGKNLVNGGLITNSATALYTVPATVNRVVINQARIVNYTAGPITFDLWILQNGESAANRYKALDTISVAANTTRLLTEIIGDSIDAGGTITIQASATTSLSFSATGTEITA